MTTVRPVDSSRDLQAFIAFPYELHARDPLWVPPLRRDVALLLNRRKNPFFEHAEAEYFIAWRGSMPAARFSCRKPP